MAKMIEYINPQPHPIQLPSPDKKTISIPGKSKVILSEWYLTYCPKYLRVVRVMDKNRSPLTPKEIGKKAVKYTPPAERTPKIKPNDRRKPKAQKGPNPRSVKVQVPNRIERAIERRRKRDEVVGKRSKENLGKLYENTHKSNGWSVSNNIGVGILSYNRLPSLQRLVASIRKHTDLNRTTIFISDESTDTKVSEWLSRQKDVVVLTRQKRLGIAGNSNRLLRCLSRFKYGFILNDDVEILKAGWENFYVEAAQATRYHHFCYQQMGVYGTKSRGKIINAGKHRISMITDKPHGAVMFYTNELFNKVGYFDEQFGLYGLEHVDWSTRASRANLQTKGYYDVIGSENYFKIHQEQSAVKERVSELSKARSFIKNVESPSRIYVAPTAASQVPSISIVIPVRDIGRKEAIGVVINAMRAQKFPNIEIIVSEQDETPKLKETDFQPYQYFFAKNKYRKQPFTKAMAFNLGIANASHEKIILQDADIVCASHYADKIYHLLDQYDGLHIGSKVIYFSEKSTKEIVRTQSIDKNKECVRAVVYFEGGSLACTKEAYFKCGGFNEIFEGYGIEDCDFFDRLKHHANFYNERSEDFVHLYHGRTSGWQQHHRRNKKIFQQLKKQYNNNSYIASLVLKIKKTYPEIAKYT